MLQRKLFNAHHHLHRFFFGSLHSDVLERRLDGIDSTAFAEHNLRWRLPHHVPMEREQLRRIILAAVLPPARDNAGLDLKQLLAHHRPVARHFVSR